MLIIMNDRTKTGLLILQVAIPIGILGDLLLRAMPWGLNVLLFNAAFVAGMVMILWRYAREQLTAQTITLFGAQLFFAAMFVWRASVELRLADTVAILLILGVLSLPKLCVTPRIAGVIHYLGGFAWSSLNALFAPFLLLFSDIEWKFAPKTGVARHLISVIRGLAIAVPIIIVFGALFMAADAAYEGLVQGVFNINPAILFSHILMFAIFAWMSAGYLRGVVLTRVDPVTAGGLSIVSAADTVGDDSSDDKESKVDRFARQSGEHPITLPGDRSVVEHLNISDPPDPVAEARTSVRGSDQTQNKADSPSKQWSWANIDNSLLPSTFTLGTVEVGVILGLTNLLFLSFVLVQVPYLFGGMEHVQATVDLKLADYARRGFGELVVVSALVLPTLLVGHWLIRKENAVAERLFRVLAGVQIALLFVIMASAVQRLVLLTGSLGYGMTTIRLYPLIFMIWLAIVFVWFGMTVLRGLRQYFAWGALWSAFFILGATHFLDPDEFIVKTNVALMQHGREFDARYNTSLGDDAIPVLVEAFPYMNADDQRTVAIQLARHYCRTRGGTDLRSLNISRNRAASLLDPTGSAANIDCESPFLFPPKAGR